jgi:hypothetical protein
MPLLPLADRAMFAQPDAYFISGTELRIDGGTHM